MRKILFLLTLFVVLLFTLTLDQPAVAQPPQQDGPNLLRNPGFEGGFFAWSGIPEVQVAHEWTPWWIEDVDHNPRWHRPEWKRAVKANFPDRVLGGDSAQQYFTFYASHYAGMYQQVFNVTPGKTYRFSLWIQVWSSEEDNADTSVLPANPHFQIGIDPTGAALPGFARAPGTVVWSGEAPMNNHIDQWGLMSIDVVAQNSTITVYMRSSPDFANKHNDVYMDEASLVEVGAPPPPPTNTPAPTAAEPTAAPPVTVMATAATPTDTPVTATATTISPTSTATAEPTATPTPEPTATNTSAPTATLEPSATPTAEPTSTATPEPTAVASRTATSQGTAVASANTPPGTDPEQPTATTEATAADSTDSASFGFGTGFLFGLLIALILGGIFFFLRRQAAG